MVVSSADTIWNDLLKSFKKEWDLMWKMLQVYELLNLFKFKKLAVAYNLIILMKLCNFYEIPGKISFTLNVWMSKNQLPFLEIIAIGLI